MTRSRPVTCLLQADRPHAMQQQVGGIINDKHDSAGARPGSKTNSRTSSAVKHCGGQYLKAWCCNSADKSAFKLALT